jgi:hypothetical protein
VTDFVPPEQVSPSQVPPGWRMAFNSAPLSIYVKP